MQTVENIQVLNLKFVSSGKKHWGLGPQCPIEKIIRQIQGMTISIYGRDHRKSVIQTALPNRAEGNLKKIS